ncbi:hypothetical protein A6D6_01061 [Alcanivorax xiamenensis]|uniref:Uncharacterized protein n=1 Tax=Alcanivorax xiamenensis TaxID=1177156 RepID=A0ABQ6YBR3_9GAMM|nr:MULTISPECIES: FxsA family protein [Alcanivorax]KAF0807062.1 hypothetical protein A6D6_01061 [Alcanivorax xiamenensis]
MTFGRLFFVIFAFALLEVLVLAAVADVIGWPVTIILTLATAIIGSWLFRGQGLKTWTRLNQRMQSGEMPGQELVEGLLLLIGGALLITPGFVSDIVGFLMLVPLSRRRLAAMLVRRGTLQAFSSQQSSAFFYQSGSFNGGPFGGGRHHQGNSQGNGVIIDGEAREETESRDPLGHDQNRRS